MNKQIPIFFSTDDKYAPYLDVALLSMLNNASKEYEYRIIVLNTGISESNAEKLKRHEAPGVSVELIDISRDVEKIRSRLKNVYHFSLVTYYRLFIASLFPQYDKVLYLDCDIVVLGDVSELYSIDLGDNILGAAPERFVQSTNEFRRYADVALGVDPDTYFNAGVLVMNLKEFRESRIEEKFIDLITKYDFDLLDPDQAYLNYLCRDKICIIPCSWNKEPIIGEDNCEKKIVHYALYKKPWQYDDVLYGNLFWQYAEKSSFYEQICRAKNSFGEVEMAAHEATAREILVHAIQIADSDYTFAKKLVHN